MTQKRIMWVRHAKLKNDAMKESLYADVRERGSVIFYCDMKFEWVGEACTVCCTRNERIGLAWFKAGTWKIRGMRKGLIKG
jgi:hypothetical protein